MAQIRLKALIGKLNDVCRQSLEGAAGICLSRTNYNVEIEHWLMKLLEAADNDFAPLARHYEIDTSRLTGDLTRAMDKLKTGNSRAPALSPNITKLIREAWLLGSIHYNAAQVRSGYLLAALVADESLRLMANDISDEFVKLSPEALQRELADVLAGSASVENTAAVTAAGGPVTGAPAAAGGRTPSLDQFTIDLTGRAKAGEIDPVIGRDPEIRQIVDILTRRRQNNPILTGEAGVGKTAVVEGFAKRIAEGDVPEPLQGVSVRTLDLGLLQAGAGIKGEFENRMKSVIDEVKASPQPIILFIDEAHTLIGAGGQAGSGDAANLLKPALARGELRTIAATTWAEYKKYFEKDAALARRFQVVKIEEPDEEGALQMIRGLADTLEKHHHVRILEEGVVDSVRLSHRYLSGRQLPDKAISLLDTACARVAISHASTPPAVEDCRRRIDQTKISIDILKREQVTEGGHEKRLEELSGQLTEAETELEALEDRWEKEAKLTTRVRELREKLEATVATADDDPAAGLSPEEQQKVRSDLDGVSAELAELQGEEPLMKVCVDGNCVAEVVAGWTGIPMGRMVADEIKTVLSLKELLEERVIGQSHALELFAKSIRTARADLTDPRRPIGVFMLAGPSGVGKTETAISLAETLYGGDQNMTVINMSEFKEEHKISLLMGSPPGYVGYGEGGVLTEAVRRRPYSVVLLDELEKAHESVQEIFYQVFDKGTLRDGEGRDIDFKNTVIIATSNAGSDLITKLCSDPETRPDPEAMAAPLHDELLKTFKPAFLGRLTIVPYYPLTDEVMQGITRLQLGRIEDRIRTAYEASFTYAEELLKNISDRCTEVESGARNVDHILTRTLLPELSEEFLARLAEGKTIANVHVDIGPDGGFQYHVE